MNLIKSELTDLQNKIKNMFEDEKRIEQANKIVNTLVKIFLRCKKTFVFNNQNQEGHGLKILKLDQILSRLPISLAQLKVWNNSKKRKNEVRQLPYSSHHSRKLTKTIYNDLIGVI